MIYHSLDAANWRHIYLVGDLHGCRQLLEEQLVAHRFDPRQDLLLSVGDLIDRGPNSLACLALLNEPWFRCVRGNHEAMALGALINGDHAMWEMNGGEWFYRLRGSRTIEAKHALMRCRDLPLILQLQINGKVMVIAHADYPGTEYAWGKRVDEHALLWGRERISQLQQGIGANIRGADAFWFGHTPLDAPLHVWNQHYIDTGAVFGNRLTLVQLQ